jgi:hypothetical protein
VFFLKPTVGHELSSGTYYFDGEVKLPGTCTLEWDNTFSWYRVGKVVM